MKDRTSFPQLHAHLVQDAEHVAPRFFGNSVAVAGKYVVVGAYGTDVSGVVNSGSAYVFRSIPLPAPCPGDADNNRAVNFADITSVLANFNLVCP